MLSGVYYMVTEKINLCSEVGGSNLESDNNSNISSLLLATTSISNSDVCKAAKHLR